MTHINLNDGSCAGLAFPALKLMSLQYHPEASPGPHDSDTCKCLADCDTFAFMFHVNWSSKSWPKHRIKFVTVLLILYWGKLLYK